jgi:hypothetical protein
VTGLTIVDMVISCPLIFVEIFTEVRGFLK